jgi:hypothetical protein
MELANEASESNGIAIFGMGCVEAAAGVSKCILFPDILLPLL